MSDALDATKEFLIESHENLDQLDLDLVALDTAADRAPQLSRIFRTLHTIKGSCAFLGFARLEAIAHAGESLLGLLRDGKLELTPGITDALLAMVDAIRKMLAAIENNGNDGQERYEPLIAWLSSFKDGSDARQTAAPSRVAPPSSTLVSKTLVQPPDAPASVEVETGGEAGSSSVYDASVRIHVDLLDKLMRIAGEIVLARNQILQYSQTQDDPSFQNTCRQLNLITTELQEHVMKTRLQPLGNVWSRFPRLVRDTALACGKKVRLETEGSETELDKTLIEAIRDPLTHLVRNAIDHGIESPEQRAASGKPEEGTVRLRAYHEGGQVNVEISDDGGGIDPERIKNRAIEQNLLTAEQAAAMSTQTLLGLIFRPGFSTASTVTTLSGRGVGMDVVKTNIEKIGGSVDVQSAVGHGTTVRIRIPLTLAIIKVLVVSCAGDRYAIPQVSLLELVRLEGEQARRGIEWIQDAPLYRLRGNLLPLVYLGQQLCPEGFDPRGNGAGPDDPVEINIVVLQADGRQFGLVVDAIGDTEEIVVKPLQKQLKGISAFSGATIMGDGKVALILDVLGLAQMAKVVGGARDTVASETDRNEPRPAAEQQTVLLFAARGGGRMAVPLSMVHRLEEFPSSAVERIGQRAVVQYRDEILPLVPVSRILRQQAGPVRTDRASLRGRAGRKRARRNGGPLHVVVCECQGRRAGLVVDRILDIAEETIVSRAQAHRPGVLFTAVIQGCVTEFLDVEGILRKTDPNGVGNPPATATKA